MNRPFFCGRFVKRPYKLVDYTFLFTILCSNSPVAMSI